MNTIDDDPYRYAVRGPRLRAELFWRKSVKLATTGDTGTWHVGRRWPPVRWNAVPPTTGPVWGDYLGDLAGHTLTFVGGLHRSGTTVLAKALAAHPEASGFQGTGVIEDEGQFLQSTYPLAATHGGPGLFAFSPAMHMTDRAPAANRATAARLFAEWRPYWDLSRRVLIEKSPANLIKTRFLQSLFPDSRFVVVVRHPIASVLAVRKWSRTSLDSLIRHWLTGYRLVRCDASSLKHLLVVRYEDLVERPGEELARLHAFLGLPPSEPQVVIRKGVNDAYLERWARLAGRSRLHRRYFAALEGRFEAAVREFGYSLRDPRWLAAGPPF